MNERMAKNSLSKHSLAAIALLMDHLKRNSRCRLKIRIDGGINPLLSNEIYCGSDNKNDGKAINAGDVFSSFPYGGID